MSYELRPDEGIERGLRRITTELIDHALARIDKAAADRQAAVHDVRKDCKRARGLLRLVRPAAPALYREENRRFRDAARLLGGVRDVRAAIETYDDLMSTFSEHVDRQSMAPVRRALTLHERQVLADDDRFDEQFGRCRDALLDIRERVPDWTLPDERERGAGFALLGPGLAKTYKRGRRAMRAAYEVPGTEAFHEWRKRAKYLRYHLRLLRPAWPALLKPMRKEVKLLGDLLGDEHDLVVLREVLPRAMDLDAQPERKRLLLALMARRSEELRARAQWLGRRIYAERPGAIRKRMRTYWTAAVGEQTAGKPG